MTPIDKAIEAHKRLYDKFIKNTSYEGRVKDGADFITIESALRGMQSVDLEKLKWKKRGTSIDDTQFYQAMEKGFNACIDHLAARGYLNTPATSDAGTVPVRTQPGATGEQPGAAKEFPRSAAPDLEALKLECIKAICHVGESELLNSAERRIVKDTIDRLAPYLGKKNEEALATLDKLENCGDWLAQGFTMDTAHEYFKTIRKALGGDAKGE